MSNRNSTYRPGQSHNRRMLLPFSAFLLIIAGFAVASIEFATGSSSRRGQSVEFLWHGVQAVFGMREAENMGMVWLGRALVAGGIVLVVLWVRRKRQDAAAVEGPGPAPGTGI